MRSRLLSSNVSNGARVSRTPSVVTSVMSSRAPTGQPAQPRPSAPASPVPVLKATGLSRVYGEDQGAMTWALRDASLTVMAGEFVGVMGPSGSGKTTLLNLLAAIDTPTAGKVEINGTDISKLSDRDLAVFRRRTLGFVFQDYNLLHTLSVQENIVLPLALEGVEPKTILARLREVSQQLGIEGILQKRVYQLSGGEQQRAAIARAIIHRPSLILADEPTGNLDSKSSASVMKALSDLNGWATMGSNAATSMAKSMATATATTILMVTHDPFAASFCKRILFIGDGRIHSELHRTGSRQTFYQEILHALTTQGGAEVDLTASRA